MRRVLRAEGKDMKEWRSSFAWLPVDCDECGGMAWLQKFFTRTRPASPMSSVHITENLCSRCIPDFLDE